MQLVKRILSVLAVSMLFPVSAFPWYAEVLRYQAPMVSEDGALVAYEAQRYSAGRNGGPPPDLFVADTQTLQTWPVTHNVQLFEQTPWGEVLFSTFWGVFVTSPDGKECPRQIYERFPRNENFFDSRLSPTITDTGVLPDKESIVVVLSDCIQMNTTVLIGSASSSQWKTMFTDHRGINGRLSPECSFLVMADRFLGGLSAQTRGIEREVPGRIIGFLPGDSGVVFESSGQTIVQPLDKTTESSQHPASEDELRSVVKERIRSQRRGDWNVSLSQGRLIARNRDTDGSICLTIGSGRLKAWEKGSQRIFVEEFESESGEVLGMVSIRADPKAGGSFVQPETKGWWERKEFGHSPRVFIQKHFGRQPVVADELWIWDDRVSASAPRLLAPRRANF